MRFSTAFTERNAARDPGIADLLFVVPGVVPAAAQIDHASTLPQHSAGCTGSARRAGAAHASTPTAAVMTDVITEVTPEIRGQAVAAPRRRATPALPEATPSGRSVQNVRAIDDRGRIVGSAMIGDDGRGRPRAWLLTAMAGAKSRRARADPPLALLTQAYFVS